MLRASSSTTRTFWPRSDFIGLVQALQHVLLGFRQIRDHAVQEQRRFVEQAVRATGRPSSTMLFATALSCRSSSAFRSLPVKTTIGTLLNVGSAFIWSSSSKPLMSGNRRSSTQQSNARCAAPPAPQRPCRHC